MINKSIPVETLRALLSCDPVNGTLTWRHRPLEYFAEAKNPERACASWNTRFAGKEALTSDVKGYRHGSIFGSLYYAHRVIYAMATGEWPPDQIDHINGDPVDNRIQNLRAATQMENGRNQPMPCTNTSGVVGVHWHKAGGKWQASIRVGGKNIHLGMFDRIENAAQARKFAEIEYGFHENHGRLQ